MTSTIELPVWMVFLSLGLAALWLIQHFLLPSARWFLRRRANRLIADVNSRLALRIPSFKLTRRTVLIDRLTYHPRVVTLVDELSSERDLPREALMKEVNEYAREIVPAFNALMYFKAAYWVARRVVHAMYRVRLGFADDEMLGQLDENSSVVFLMNHRSNMDYILATYLAADRTALSYAVGEWARVWPLQQLIRTMGGYFVRRDSGDPLYRRVLECYVQMAAEGGVPQAVFPEGRLTRDGKLQAPKLGLLGYLTRGFDPKSSRDIVFIPVGINYDRVFEDRTQLRAAAKLPRRNILFSVRTVVKYLVKSVWQRLLGKRYRNGYACVNFGTPVSLKAWMKNHPGVGIDPDTLILDDVSELAEDLMQRIGSITPILPVALVTHLFQKNPKRVYSEIELKREVLDLLDQLTELGHRAYIPRGDYDYAVNVGVRMLTLRRILFNNDGLLSANPKDTELISYYANSIAHLIPSESTIEPGKLNDLAP